MLNKSSSKAGFTLLEILIAVLIIGVLSSVALPLYRGAIDKSRWSKLLAPARAVATAQEAAYMSQGGYTANIDDLDISLPEGGDMTYTLYTTANGDDANFVRIASSNLDNVRLARYYKRNEGFEDQLYCEAKNGDERANRLCGKLLNGEELVNTNDGYKMYLLKDAITKPLCDKVELWWSNNFTHCYKTEEERCTANNMQYDTFCGWENTNGKTINEGGTCEGTVRGGCQSSIINDGGVCEGSFWQACIGSTINEGGKCVSAPGSQRQVCQNVTVNNGGECIAQAGAGSETCHGAKVYDGGKCIAETGSSVGCMGTEIYKGGVCDGRGQVLGAAGGCYRVKVYEGGVCLGNEGKACSLGSFYNGSVCEGNATGACHNKDAPGLGGSFYEGSTCNGNVAQSCGGEFKTGSVCNGKSANSCEGMFHGGARCVAHVSGSCNGTYEEGSCCEGGDNCPANAPRC